jgi:hypothetical protein
MSVVRVMLGYVLIFCLVLVGTLLVMLGMAFVTALLWKDWHTAALRVGFLASGIGMWVIADLIERKIRQKRPDTSKG